MLKFICRGILLPFVYLFTFVKVIIKYLVVIPVVFAISLLLKLWFIIIAAIIAGVYFTPIVTVIVCILALIFVAKSAAENTGDFMLGKLDIDWSHKRKLSDDYRAYRMERKALKGYKKYSNEFIGFDIISDVYRKG